MINTETTISSDELLASLAAAVESLNTACAAIDVAKERDRCESQIMRERFFAVVQKIGNALTGCIEAEATLRSYISIFGPYELALDEDEGEARSA